MRTILIGAILVFILGVGTQVSLDEQTTAALAEILDDERRAEATYEAVIAKFGSVRPFSNIVEAERQHQQMVLDLYRKYGLQVPENRWSGQEIAVPATLGEACEAGIQAERANIALIDKWLETVKEKDIRDTFVYLRNASERNHLPAFRRCSKRNR